MDLISNQETSRTVTDSPELSIIGCRVLALGPFTKTVKGEDAIVCKVISDKFATVVVADGASERVDRSSGAIISGAGGAAASMITEAVFDYLDHELSSEAPSLLFYLGCLRKAYEVGADRLRQEHAKGASTLLMAFLSEVEDGRAFWFYSYEGDGSIVLVNPRRKLDGHLIRTWLLSPQRFESTATLSSDGPQIPPVVGCLEYVPGDMMYLASDGVDALDRWLQNKKSTFLANYLFGVIPNDPESLPARYAQLESQFTFSDDAVLGIIWTSEKGA